MTIAKLLVVLLAALALAACSSIGQKTLAPVASTSAPRAPAPPAPVRNCSVALYGDSILWGGYGATMGTRLQDPPAVALRRIRPAWVVSDHSVIGDSAHKRSPSFLKERISASVVVLQYGINDVGNNYAYEPALRAMAQHAKVQGKVLVITGLSRVRGSLAERTAQYDATARRVASETGAVFADWSTVAFDPAHMADDIHPAQPYSSRLNERLAATLDRAVPACSLSAAGPVRDRNEESSIIETKQFNGKHRLTATALQLLNNLN
jgi:lysophospholipase L1-like esterase